MNKTIIKLSTLSSPINITDYCPVYKKNEFYNFKERLFVQLDNIDAKVFTHEKYGNSMVIKSDSFNKFIIQPLEEELKIRNSIIWDEYETVRIKLKNTQYKVDNVKMSEVETLPKQLTECNIILEVMYYKKSERTTGISLTCKLLVYDTTSVIDTIVEEFDLI